MVKKRKKRKKRKRKASTLSNSVLQKELEKALSAHKYQQAIVAGKELIGRDLQCEVADKVRKMLRQAYRGRILALAKKNMFREAFALIDTAASRCGKESMVKLHLTLSIRAGKWRQAAKIWSQYRDEFDKAERDRVEALFALLLLTGSEEISEGLPDDSPVKTHWGAAAKALDALSQGRHDEARQALRDVPFRSPYRDFRSLLSGCVLLSEKDEAGAEKFFHKIKADSPWGHAVSIIRQFSVPPDQLMEYIAESGYGEDDLLSALFNLKPVELKFIRSVKKACHNGFALLKIVDRQGKCLPLHVRNAVVTRLLPHGRRTISGYREFRKLSSYEKYRITALAAEIVHDVESAVDMWEEYMRFLPADTPDFKLRKALVLRHQAELMEKDPYEYDTGDILDCLRESLEYDPEDPGVFLRTIEMLRSFNEKEAYSLLNDAVKRFPDNTGILTEAMKAASKRNAHKKAGRIAEKILELDPVNTLTKEFLLESHLSHAAKLIKQKKFHLVEAEFEAAEEIEVRGLSLRGRAFICHGLFLCMNGHEKKGKELIDRGCRINGLPVISSAVTLLEAGKLNMPVKQQKKFEKQLQKAVSGNPAKEEVLEIARWCSNFSGAEKLTLSRILGKLKKYLSKACKLEWTMQEGLILCQGFYNANLLVQLEKIAAKFHKKLPDDKEFEAYFLLSRSRRGKRMSHAQQARMLDLVDELYMENKIDLADDLEDAFDSLGNIEMPAGFDMNEVLLNLLNGAGLVSEEDIDDLPDDEELPGGPDKGGKSGKKSGSKRRKKDKRQRSIFDLL